LRDRFNELMTICIYPTVLAQLLVTAFRSQSLAMKRCSLKQFFELIQANNEFRSHYFYWCLNFHESLIWCTTDVALDKNEIMYYFKRTLITGSLNIHFPQIVGELEMNEIIS